LPNLNLENVDDNILATLTFADYFAHKFLHKTPNVLILFFSLLETKLKGI